METLRWTVSHESVDEPWTREDAGRLFARLMREQGVARWRRRAAYLAVRIVAAASWGRPCQPEPAPAR